MRLKSPLTLALGKDIGGQPMVADLARMPHLLIAGTTGSGKSVALNAMVLSLLYKSTPENVRLIMIDPKMLELSVYEGIPHLLAPVVTDMKQAANALRWCVAEMERRYALMAGLGVRHLSSYNRKVNDAIESGKPLLDPTFVPDDFEQTAPELRPMPFIVVIIDELADMMMMVGKKVEELIARLAQKARASGIHMIVATQRPSVDVITGLIKANIPCRIAFQVSAQGRFADDSRPDRRRASARPRRHVVFAFGHVDADSRARRVRFRQRGASPSSKRCARAASRTTSTTCSTGPGPRCRGSIRRADRRIGRRARSPLRSSRTHRDGNPQSVDLRHSAPLEDRLQPRGANGRDHGRGWHRWQSANEWIQGSLGAAASGRRLGDSFSHSSSPRSGRVHNRRMAIAPRAASRRSKPFSTASSP